MNRTFFERKKETFNKCLQRNRVASRIFGGIREPQDMHRFAKNRIEMKKHFETDSIRDMRDKIRMSYDENNYFIK